MRDCKHLDIKSPMHIHNDLYRPQDTLCKLKTVHATRIKLATEATDKLGVICPPNHECHYYPHDSCEKCQSYAKWK